MLRDFFRDEAHEALERLTTKLLGCGDDQPGDALITELMRTTHTLKGSAGTVGLPAVVDAAHRLEDQLSRLRGPAVGWSGALLDRFVETIDSLRALVDVAGTGDGESAAGERVRDNLAGLADVTADGAVPLPIGEPDSAGASAPRPAARGSGAIEPSDAIPVPIEPHDGDTPQASISAGAVVVPIEDDSTDTTRSIVTGEVSVPYAMGMELSSGERAAGGGPGGERRRDAAILRVEPGRIDLLMDSVGELVFDRTRIERRVQQLRSLAKELGRTRQALRDQIGSIRSATRESGRETIEHELLDIEVELARQATQLSRATANLLDDTEALRRTTTSLQDGLTRVRMQTARTMFERLARTFRAITRGIGKKVNLVTTGDETEFDKSVAEQITDPLIQLLRNAVAHGIEPASERIARGKDPVGEIRIDARHEGGLLILEVADDGGGIDPQSLRRRLVVSDRWTQARADVATDEDVLHAIFDAGISTRDEADELAGRGVGLDAVRETIARLGGEIRMTSTPGRGTVFTMRLPVSTAVSQALLFKVDGQVYAVPNVHVVETAQLETPEGIGPDTITVRDDRLPLVVLHQVLAGRQPGNRSCPAVIVEYAGKRLGFTCDKIVGPREIVVKHLGPLLAPLPLYAGATISGSGKVQLILDPAALVRLAYPEAAPVEASAPGRAAVQLAGRVLVVDDSRAIREAMTRILSRLGYIVDLAEDGLRAWQMVQQLRYDLVITDLEMPGAGGFELVERLRGDDRHARTPVIIVSSRATAANRRRARSLGVRTFIAKPVTRRKVEDALRKGE